MKHITLLVLLFSFSFAFAVMSEDLGELAKKEKARRESLEKSGKKAKVLTNEDVENLKSQLSILSESEEGDNTASEENTVTEETTYTPPEEGADYVSDPVPQPQASDSAADLQKQVRELEEQKEQAEKESAEARGTVGAGGLYHSRNTGDQYRKAREAEAKQEKLDKQIDDVRSKEKTSQSQAESPRPQEPPPYEEPPAEETQAVEETTTEEPPL